MAPGETAVSVGRVWPLQTMVGPLAVTVGVGGVEIAFVNGNVSRLGTSPWSVPLWFTAFPAKLKVTDVSGELAGGAVHVNVQDALPPTKFLGAVW